MHPSHMLSRPRQLAFCLFCLTLFVFAPQVTGEKRKLSRFAREIYAWGKGFSQKLPAGWRMEWYPSQLSQLHWLSSPSEGYRIRFVHETRKVYIPVSSPERDKPSMGWRPHECSLHFYPLTGRYTSEWTKLSIHKPARVFAILRRVVIFRPDRFASEEYPCPEILETFQKHHPNAFRQRLLPQRKYPKRLKKEDIQRIIRFRNYAEIHFNEPWKTTIWRNIAKQLGIKSIVLRYSTSERAKQQIIHFRRKR